MPLDVTASGNSAISSSLIKVVFLTSSIFLSHKKSNLVSSEYLNSARIFFTELNSFINLFSKACSTILFAL